MARPAGLSVSTLLLAGTCLVSSVTASDRFSLLQIRFGVPVEIQLEADDEPAASKAMLAAFAEAKRLDGIFSDYDPDSEARRLADAEPNRWYAASPELVEVSRSARTLASLTDGAFDISVGPLTHLWRKTMRFKRAPDATRVADAIARVGNDRWDVRDGEICFRQAGMRLDYGGIAKGYALDRMASVLREHGIDSYLIDAGGDLICGQPPTGRDGWRIEIERPSDRMNATAAPRRKPLVLTLANRAVATSGATYQSVTLDGVRYSHIVDPRTGYGVRFLANVTVEADRGWLADALASAVSVCGRDIIPVIQKHYPGAKVTILNDRTPTSVDD